MCENYSHITIILQYICMWFMSGINNRELVYVTEPSWFESSIPEWVSPKCHLVITDSERVVDEADKNGIEVITVGSVCSNEMLSKINGRSIISEQKAISRIKDLMGNEHAHFAESLRGISAFIYEMTRLYNALSIVLRDSSASALTFIYGSYFNADIQETPKGGLFVFLLIRDLCKYYNVKLKVRSHCIVNKSKIRDANSYDRGFYERNKDLKSAYDSYSCLQSVDHSYKNKVMFLYFYEQCLDDLEPLKKYYESNNDYQIVLCKAGSHAPVSIRYDFDVTGYQNGRKKRPEKLIKKIEKSLKKEIIYLLTRYLSNCAINSISVLARSKTNKILSGIDRCAELLEEVYRISKESYIRELVMVGLSGVPQAILASYMSMRGIKVSLRQHGGLSNPDWPEKCRVNNCDFIVNSEFYKKNIDNNKGIARVIPRQRYRFATVDKYDVKKRNRVLITEDLFFDPTNKKVSLEFIDEFLEKLPKNILVTFRSHPRYSGNMNIKSGSNDKRISRVSARNQGIGDALSDACAVIMLFDTLSSVICDAIMGDVPGILVVPSGRKAVQPFEYADFDYPLVVKKTEELVRIINKLQENNDYRHEVLHMQKKWLDEIYGREDKDYFSDLSSINLNSKYVIKKEMRIKEYLFLFYKNKIKTFKNNIQTFLLTYNLYR